MENKHRVNWELSKTTHLELSKLADKQKRSVQNLATLLIERGLEDEKRIEDNKTLERELAELKGVEIINGCVNINHLKSASNYINLFNMGFGSSEILNNAYNAKKQLLIN